MVLVVALLAVVRQGVETLKADPNSIGAGRKLDANCVRKIVCATCDDNGPAFYIDRTFNDMIELFSIKRRLLRKDGDSNGNVYIPNRADPYSAGSKRKKAFDRRIGPRIRKVAINVFVLDVELVVIGKQN